MCIFLSWVMKNVCMMIFCVCFVSVATTGGEAGSEEGGRCNHRPDPIFEWSHVGGEDCSHQGQAACQEESYHQDWQWHGSGCGTCSWGVYPLRAVCFPRVLLTNHHLPQDRMFLDDATKDIMSKERLHRTRTTVLQSSGKVGSFHTILFFVFVTCAQIPR